MGTFRRHWARARSLTSTTRSTWQRLGAGSGKLLLLGLAGSVFRSLLVLPLAYVVHRMLDHSLPHHDVAGLLLGSLLLLGLFALSAVATYVTRRTVLRLTQDALENLRLQVLRKIYDLPRSFFTSVSDSDIESLIVQDSARIEFVLATTVSTVLPSIVVAVVVAVVAAIIQPLLFVLVAVAVPVTLLVARVSTKRVHRRSQRWKTTMEAYNADVSRALRAMTLTKVLGARDVEIARQTDTIKRLHSDALAMANEQASARAWMSAAFGLGTALLLTVGVIEVSRNTLTTGALVSFYAVIAVLTRQVRVVLWALPDLAAAASSYQRIEKLLSAPDALAYSGTQPHVVHGALELQGVSFGYEERLVLRDVSLSLHPGEHVALLGPNGAGKSTLVMLALGLYRPSNGTLLLDGIPYDDVDLEDLHRACGVVLQDPVLLPGTIREAIAYGRSHVALAEVEQAAGMVGLHDFVSTLPDGYDTLVGDEGVLLSGGQRQRVALARALIGRPRVLVLDEPTNHLDDGSVALLLASLAGLTPRPTILTITHDLAVAEAADRVLHLRDGSLVGQEVSPSGASFTRR